MKLSSSQVERTLHQLQAQALPDNHPSLPELNRVFGDHTFFLDESGLHIVEPAVPNEEDERGWTSGQTRQLAGREPHAADGAQAGTQRRHRRARTG